MKISNLTDEEAAELCAKLDKVMDADVVVPLKLGDFSIGNFAIGGYVCRQGTFLGLRDVIIQVHRIETAPAPGQQTH